MKKLLIKNMVCDRCKTLLAQEFAKAGIAIVSIKLGEIVYGESVDNDDEKIEGILKNNGFELVKDTADMIIENIKIQLINTINNGENDIVGNMSTFLSEKLNKDYSILSKMFSKKEGVTIEKYYIDLKIERAKELIQMNELNFSEIGYALNYRNSSHLASQFKSVTGMSMGEYKKLQQWDRKPLDKIM
ncbi:helix-turn-helix protein [Arenibacter algicola]|jgi:AraC-like DNA-binding protein|uniref:Helix-turn-helix protein n=1 Tax=Arenibacter algicola TaxID=616991 RepID=A0ABY3AEI6_9FLAO|nr:helix-turn-helix domain-containing protein [Arenibacter algicola]|tara:strand:- start:65 stop:628 length:564 start_codon:yes stop_codon:yes gene_type:complete